MPVLNRRSPYRNWRMDQAWGQNFTINRASPQATGLVAWWPTLGNIGSAALYDKSLRNNNGVLQNLATWASPYATQPNLGIAIDYPANTGDRYVALPGNILSGDVYSVCAWFVTDEINVYRAIFSIYTANNDACEVFIDTVNARLFGAQFSNRIFTANNSIATGVLYHVVLASDGVNTRFYLNGFASGTTGLISFSTFSTAGTIGARTGGAGDLEFNGRIGDVRVYNRTLSAAEAFAFWAPSTRWDLYKPIPRAFFMSQLAVGIPMPIIPLRGIHSVIGGGQIVR